MTKEARYAIVERIHIAAISGRPAARRVDACRDAGPYVPARPGGSARSPVTAPAPRPPWRHARLSTVGLIAGVSHPGPPPSASPPTAPAARPPAATTAHAAWKANVAQRIRRSPSRTSAGTWSSADQGSSRATSPSAPGKTFSGSSIPEKKMPGEPGDLAHTRAVHEPERRTAPPDTGSRSSRRSPARPRPGTASQVNGSAGSASSEARARRTPSAPRRAPADWNSARPRSRASHHSWRSAGRYRSIAMSPVRIRSISSSSKPPPIRAITANSACPSHT